MHSPREATWLRARRGVHLAYQVHLGLTMGLLGVSLIHQDHWGWWVAYWAALAAAVGLHLLWLLCTWRAGVARRNAGPCPICELSSL